MTACNQICVGLLFLLSTVTANTQDNYTSVKSGNWSDPATWGLMSGDPTGGDGKIENGDIVHVQHEIDYDLSNALDIINGELIINHIFTITTQQNVIVREDGILTVSAGEFIIPIENGGSNANGNLSVLGGTSYFEDSTIEIAQDWEATEGALRTVIDCCLKVGENYLNDGAIDIYNGLCLEYGLHGFGNFENNSAGSSIDCSMCTILDMGSGNFENIGDFTGGSLAVLILMVNGNLTNDGNWSAEISNYCIMQNIDGANAEDFNEDLPGFENCALAMGVTCACPTFQEITPVEYLFFKGYESNRKAILEWATIQEVNNKGFEIQRSSNGVIYKTIAFIDGHGTRTGRVDYHFTDMSPLLGNNIYRLKQIDENGLFDISHPVVISIDGHMSVEAIPNPCISSQLSLLYFNDFESDSKFMIFNQQGAIIHQINLHTQAGGNEIELGHLNLPGGIYFVKVQSGIQSISSKFMIIE